MLNSPPNQSLQFTEIGNGPPMVLLHGWGMHSKIWQPLTDKLAEQYRLICVDLPGCGLSYDVMLDYDLDLLTQQLKTICPQPAIWLGWSLGGIIAMAMAVNYPACVAQLICIASSPHFLADDDWPGIGKAALDIFQQQLQTNSAHTLHQFLQLQCRGLANAKAMIHSLIECLRQHPSPHTHALTGGLRLLKEGDIRHQIAKLTLPIDMIFGSHDRIVPAETAAAVTRLNPQIRTKIIDKASHMPFFTHTELCYQTLMGWLA